MYICHSLIFVFVDDNIDEPDLDEVASIFTVNITNYRILQMTHVLYTVMLML